MIVDLFAGPGGWSEGLRSLGLSDVGFEWDAAACATRAAAGHLTVRADIADYPTEPLRGRVEGLIASPPCQAFSVAGKQQGRPTAFLAALEGRYDSRAVRAEIAEQRAYRQAWERERAKLLDEHPEWLTVREVDDLDGVVDEAYLTDEGIAAVIQLLGPAPQVEDERGMFMAEAVRWAEDLSPEWIACEQVPPGLDMWRLFARWLADRGYSTWCGVLNAADYGVPQTRRRAILMASRVRRVAPPPPTHCDQRHSPSLFLLPWVSMAEALGWGDEVEAVSDTMSADNHGNSPVYDPRKRPSRVVTTVPQRVVNTRGDRQTPGGNEFDPDAPSWALTEKARSWKVLHTNRGQDEHGNRQQVDLERPAPTLAGEQCGVDEPVVLTRKTKRARPRPADEPAPSIAFGHDVASWAWKAPATTVAGDPRITARCHHDEGSQGADAKTTEQVRAGDYQGTEPIRLTVEEALVLQSFRPDYPVKGSRTAQFRQVGDAVPPCLAAAIVAELAKPDRRPPS